MNPREVYFNDIDLSAVMTIDNLDVNQYPNFDIKRYKIARADESVTTSKEAVSKEITISGRICGTSRSTIEANLALLKLILAGIRGQLQVKQAGLDIIYTATCDGIGESWDKSVLLVELTFTAGDPYGIATNQTVQAIPNITSATESFTLTSNSSVPIKPEITLTFDSVTDGTNKTVSITNSSTNIGISINTTFTTGDVLYLNSQTMVSTLNGDPIDFTGVFPIFDVTIASIFIPQMNITYTDDFTDRDVNGTVSFYARV